MSPADSDHDGPRIELTHHAKEMLVERGIKQEWVDLTIRRPAALEPDPLRPGVLRAFRRIAERGNQFLRVVYIQTGETVRVITVFFDRGRRR